MPAQILRPEMMDEDQLMKEVLDKFVNCPEQTYEEFLSTFTHLSKDWLLLPGEVEQAISTSVPAYVPSVDLPLTSEVKRKPAMGRTPKHTEEIFGDEVQPFFLDEEFDYDNVTLTPKFTAGELATIQERAKQKRMDTNTDFCEPHD
ncbi:intraflagellar transport-associated protein isoform X3 [Peromyscus maniculatus bairdii]|uniref:intraflagellar transport-associated protein isoform X3 n=1 Tax=Peromyscus maniculatus bairdii TaxID=230844 RepID=UPI00077DE690|nr:intraflagellar transport-associated protein isoform X2 [Peromyscus maniculatus bairdii]